MSKIVHALLMVVLLELLWVSARSNGWELGAGRERRALKVSAGFPVLGISYTAIRDTGYIAAFENYPERSEFMPGLRISQIACGLDALVAAAAFFGFSWLLNHESGRSICAGMIFGAVAGVVASLGLVSAWQPLGRWIVLPILLIGLSTSACFFTRKSRSAWQAILVLVTAAFVMSWAAECFGQFQQENGFSFSAKVSSEWSLSLVRMVLEPLTFCGILLAPVLLMRRFLPSFRRYETAG